jgi:hypothetical protein
MSRLITAVAFVAATGAVPASSQGMPADTRCVDSDQAISRRLHDVLADEGWPNANTPTLNVVMSRMASARHDCKRGRTERGLDFYARADEALRTIEEKILARSARSGAAEPAR